MYLLTIKNVAVTLDKDGKEEIKEDEIIKNLLIDGESSELIKEVLPAISAEAVKAEETNPETV